MKVNAFEVQWWRRGGPSDRRSSDRRSSERVPIQRSSGTLRTVARQWRGYWLVAALAGCSGQLGFDGDKQAPAGQQEPVQGTGGGQADASLSDCQSKRSYFAQEVWAPVLDSRCLSCHAPDGVATEKNAALQLLPAEYPGFLDANIENLTMVAKLEYDGRPLLLRKPLGELDHGGGALFNEDSPEFLALADFVTRLANDDFCAEEPAVDLGDVVQLGPLETFRKASLQVARRLPTGAETQLLSEEGEGALVGLIDALLEEPAFLERLKDIYNDRFLTDLYMRNATGAINLLSSADYPNRTGDYYDALSAETRTLANEGIAREPLELIAYVVKNDLPFSEILTADYTVVNPYSALIYGVDPSFADPTDAREFVSVRLNVQREGAEVPIPHAGVLTMPAMLNRMPTTPTNRNRHRAFRVFELFLATDILRIAARPIDAEASSSYNNPTRDDPQCNGCHRQIDPIAGAFLKWSERDQERYFPAQEWYPEMFPPGFGQEVMDTADYDQAQSWLAQRITEDSRFTLATVHTLYEGLTGRKPLLYPSDASAADFAAEQLAWDRQDVAFRAAGDAFVQADMNLKTLVRALLLSPYFRAANAASEPDEVQKVALGEVGTARLSIPAVLDDKITAVTGVRWARSSTAASYLRSEYRVLYGGIDSESVTERLTTPNGIMASLASRMANEVACLATASDFVRSSEERLLFPYVELQDLPSALETGDVSEAGVTAIKANLAYLHGHVLGEHLEPGDPEIGRSYQLFLETLQEGQAGLAAETTTRALPRRCQARVHPDTGEALLAEQRVVNDETYVVRAWMAVLTYLLSDYQFLYE